MADKQKDHALRLAIHQKTKVDLVKETIPKPVGYLPTRYLPSWQTLPLEQKLPLFPAPPGAVYFSRAQLGQTLIRPHSPYTVLDPLHRVRIPTNNYERLHDPSTAAYFADERMLKVLRDQGCVNDDDEVICSVKEFNRFRLYLATLYNDKVREKFQQEDDLQSLERKMDRELIRQQQSEAGGKLAVVREKIANAKRLKMAQLEAIRVDIQHKDELVNQRMQRLAEDRVQEQTTRILENEERRAFQIQKIMKLREKEKDRRRELLHKGTLKDLNSAAYREHMINFRKIEHEKKLGQWFNKKLLSAAERIEREKEIQAIYSEGLQHKAATRQKRVEKFRSELPIRIERRLAAKQRLEDIVRKYALRWLNRVRARLYAPRDEKHESVWYSQTKHALQDGMKYLQQESGYEKLDDVVMNIMKFKEALKHQLLLEEEEEEEEEWANMNE